MRRLLKYLAGLLVLLLIAAGGYGAWLRFRPSIADPNEQLFTAEESPGHEDHEDENHEDHEDENHEDHEDENHDVTTTRRKAAASMIVVLPSCSSCPLRALRVYLSSAANDPSPET
jgi:hypothetical protein